MTDTTNLEVGGSDPAPAAEGVDPDALNAEALATEVAAEPPEPELDDDGNPIEPAEEVEELEFEGVKGKVPKALAEAVKLGAMRQADYTRKTQEVAQARAAVEQQERDTLANLTARTNLVNAHAAELVTFKALEGQLARYDAITSEEWQAARQRDRENGTTEVEDARWEIDRLRREKAAAETSLQAKVQQMEATQQQATATLISQSRAELERSIPGWNGQRLHELQSLAMKPEYGFTAADLSQAFHPGVYKVLHRLATLEAEVAKSTTAQTAQRKAQASQAAAPVPQVTGASAPARKDPEKMSPEEYQAWRRSQKAAQNRRSNGQFRAA